MTGVVPTASPTARTLSVASLVLGFVMIVIVLVVAVSAGGDAISAIARWL